MSNLEAVGAWPPISESHVEMDGAWALYEAWVALQHGDIDIALAFGSGKSSPGDPMQIYPLQMDPYTLTPLGADPTSLAALQARAMLDSGRITEREMAEVAARNRRDAIGNPYAQVSGEVGRRRAARHAVRHRADAGPRPAAVLRRRVRGRSSPPPTRPGRSATTRCGSGASTTASRSTSPGCATCASRRRRPPAGAGAGVGDGPVDLAELSVAYTHQEKILKDALGLGDGRRRSTRRVGRSTANPMMATGLSRIAEAARAIQRGDGQAGGRPRDLGSAPATEPGAASWRAAAR